MFATLLNHLKGAVKDKPIIQMVELTTENYPFIKKEVLNQALQAAKAMGHKETDSSVSLLLNSHYFQQHSAVMYASRPQTDPFNLPTTTLERYRLVTAYGFHAFMSQMLSEETTNTLLQYDADSCYKGGRDTFVQFLAGHDRIYQYSVQMTMITGVIANVVLNNRPNQRYMEAYRWLTELNIDESMAMHIHQPLFNTLTRCDVILH